MVCVVCSCCATSFYREVCRAKGGIGSGETLCYDIYLARPITTVSLAANTYCIMDGHSSSAPRTVGPRVQFRSARAQSHWWPASAYSRRPSVQIKKDTVKPSVPAREFNLKAYAAITRHNDLANPGLEPRLADHCRQAARTATLPTAPPRQATSTVQYPVKAI